MYSLCGHRTLGERPRSCACGDGVLGRGGRERFVIDWCDTCQEPWLQQGRRKFFLAERKGERRGSK